MGAIAEALPVKVIDAVATTTGNVRVNKPGHEMAERSHSLWDHQGSATHAASLRQGRPTSCRLGSALATKKSMLSSKDR